MTLTELQKLARAEGFEYLRPAKGIHQIWKHQTTGKTVMLSPSTSRLKLVKFQADLRRASR